MIIDKIIYNNELIYIGKKHESGDIYTFSFKPKNKISWLPGQYIEYRLGFGLVKHFTIASAPYEGIINLTTRIFEKHSDFKDKLLKLDIGETVHARNPEGNLIIGEPVNDYVFIAGGIGITPFRAILWQMDNIGTLPNIHLLYGSSNDEPAFKQDLDILQEKHKSLKITYHLNNKPITSDDIKKTNIGSASYLISGPPMMVESYQKMLEQLGVNPKKIKADPFTGY